MVFFAVLEAFNNRYIVALNFVQNLWPGTLGSVLGINTASDGGAPFGFCVFFLHQAFSGQQ
jgi:hypothetical protein